MRGRDRALVDRIRGGDPEGWTELYHRHGPSVYRFALRRLRDPHEAEDVRQDVFVQAMRCLGTFEGRSSLSTWLLGIAHHEVTGRRRRQFVRRGPSLDELRTEPPAPLASLDRQVDAARVLARCAQVVAREASPGQRAVFERHWLGGSVAEVARAVGRSPQAVKTSLCRTRSWLVGRVPALADLLAA